jgi:hypothetical protein
VSWAKFDDGILDNAKIAKAGLVGFAFHAAAITWCSRNLTDGFIPRQRVASLFDVTGLVTGYLAVTSPTPSAMVDAFIDAANELRPPTGETIGAFLVECGLWKYDEERDGYWLKDYLVYNPSREKVLAERARKAGNKAESRARKPPPVTAEVTGTVTAPVTGDIRRRHHVPVPVPVPKRSDLTAAADPRPVSLPRATAPSAAAAAAADRVLDSLGEEAREPEPLTQTQVRERLPSNLEEALRVPPCVRAKLVIDGRVDATWVSPELWPEVLAVAKALAEASGHAPRPRVRYQSDRGVQAVVELLAAGYMPSDLVKVASKLPREAWWNQGDRKRGLSTLSVEVVDRALAEPSDNAGRELLARVDASLAKGKRSQADEGGTPLGSLLGSIGGAR